MSRSGEACFLGVFVSLCLFGSACAKVPYRPRGDMFPNAEPIEEGSQFSRGEPNVIADSLGHYLFSLPEKLVLWNWSMGNHDISPETEAAIREYLERNQLREVKVRLNEYAPFSEFSRLTSNEAVGAGWRYTFGILGWLFYTVLPGRIFGGDAYNPYTNSIYLYSDLPVVALHEGGHAKDTAGRKWKGSRAALRILPIVPLFDEARATNDALGYAKDADSELLRSGYKLLYPAYGTYVGAEALAGFPVVGPIAGAVGAIPGHIVGRIKAGQIPEAGSADGSDEVSSDETSEAP